MRGGRARGFASDTRPTRGPRKGFGEQIPSPSLDGQSPSLFIVLASDPSVCPKAARQKGERRDSRPRHLSQDPWEEEIPNKAGTKRRRNTGRDDERVRVVPRQARASARKRNGAPFPPPETTTSRRPRPLAGRPKSRRGRQSGFEESARESACLSKSGRSGCSPARCHRSETRNFGRRRWQSHW